MLLSFGQSYTAKQQKQQKTHFPPRSFLNVAPPTFARCPKSNSKKQAWNDRKRLLLSALGTVARSNHGVNTEAEQEAEQEANQEAAQEANQEAEQVATQEAEQEANQEAEQRANQVANQEANQEAEQEAIHRFTAELELSELAIRSFPKALFSLTRPISPICQSPFFPHLTFEFVFPKAHESWAHRRWLLRQQLDRLAGSPRASSALVAASLVAEGELCAHAHKAKRANFYAARHLAACLRLFVGAAQIVRHGRLGGGGGRAGEGCAREGKGAESAPPSSRTPSHLFISTGISTGALKGVDELLESSRALAARHPSDVSVLYSRRAVLSMAVEVATASTAATAATAETAATAATAATMAAMATEATSAAATTGGESSNRVGEHGLAGGASVGNSCKSDPCALLVEERTWTERQLMRMPWQEALWAHWREVRGAGDRAGDRAGDMSDMEGDMSDMVGDMSEMDMPDGIAAEIAQLRTRLGAAVTWGSAEQMALAEQILRRQESWAKGRSVKP